MLSFPNPDKSWSLPPQPPSLPAELAQEALKAINFPEFWQRLFVGRLSLSREGESLRALKLSFDTSVRAHRAVLRQGMGTTSLQSWKFVASDVLGWCSLPVEVLLSLGTLQKHSVAASNAFNTPAGKAAQSFSSGCSVTKLELISRSEAKHEFFMCGKKYCQPVCCCEVLGIAALPVTGAGFTWMQSKSQHRDRPQGQLDKPLLLEKQLRRALGAVHEQTLQCFGFAHPLPPSMGSYVLAWSRG